MIAAIAFASALIIFLCLCAAFFHAIMVIQSKMFFSGWITFIIVTFGTIALAHIYQPLEEGGWKGFLPSLVALFCGALYNPFQRLSERAELSAIATDESRKTINSLRHELPPRLLSSPPSAVSEWLSSECAPSLINISEMHEPDFSLIRSLTLSVGDAVYMGQELRSIDDLESKTRSVINIRSEGGMVPREELQRMMDSLSEVVSSLRRRRFSRKDGKGWWTELLPGERLKG